jgi:hypothetical protein
VVWSLGFEKRFRDEVTPPLLVRAYPTGLDLQGTLKRLYEKKATLVVQEKEPTPHEGILLGILVNEAVDIRRHFSDGKVGQVDFARFLAPDPLEDDLDSQGVVGGFLSQVTLLT